VLRPGVPFLPFSAPCVAPENETRPTVSHAGAMLQNVQAMAASRMMYNETRRELFPGAKFFLDDCRFIFTNI
jgi:hypothetical protein